MTKISIRFFNDREVRAIWDEVNSKWWFSAIDIVRAINKEDEYAKKISHPPTHPLTDNLLNILHSVN